MGLTGCERLRVFNQASETRGWIPSVREAACLRESCGPWTLMTVGLGGGDGQMIYVGIVHCFHTPCFITWIKKNAR